MLRTQSWDDMTCIHEMQHSMDVQSYKIYLRQNIYEHQMQCFIKVLYLKFYALKNLHRSQEHIFNN